MPTLCKDKSKGGLARGTLGQLPDSQPVDKKRMTVIQNGPFRIAIRAVLRCQTARPGRHNGPGRIAGHDL